MYTGPVATLIGFRDKICVSRAYTYESVRFHILVMFESGAHTVAVKCGEAWVTWELQPDGLYFHRCPSVAEVKCYTETLIPAHFYRNSH